MLDVGKRSMMNSQTALQTVGHNIANKSTEGYSRQRVELQTSEPVGDGKLRLGMGAKAAAVTRVNNSYLERQIGKETAQQGFLEGKNDALARVEQVYNEQQNRGLNQFMGDFFNAFRDLANNPESLATRTLVKETGAFLTKDFHRIAGQLAEIQRDVDQQVATQIEEVNGYSREIGTLNEKIQMVEMAGSKANDERDRRDLLLKKMGERLNVKWAEGSDGMVTVSAGNSAILVAGYDARKLEVASTPENATKAEGSLDIFYRASENSVPFCVTPQFKGGSIGGLLEARDQTINEFRADVDKLAYSLATAVNRGHEAGFDAYGAKGAAFFSLPAEVRHAAENIRLGAEVADDANRVAAGSIQGAPGDNRIANYIAGLQYEKIANGGSSTLDDHYDAMVGRVGVVSRRASSAFEAQKGIVKQLGNIRESVSGVSLDEETTRMIEFQKAFEASARVIKTADEMFDTILNLKRL
jgi:flagellar hook-associated protein 1 FlgK